MKIVLVFILENLDFMLGDFLITFLTFVILFFIGKFIYKRILKHESKVTDNRLFNADEYLPEEEITTLKQVFFLIILFLFFIIFLYNVVFKGQSRFFSVLELLLMLYVAIKLDYSSWKNRIFFFLIIPYESLIYLIYGFPATHYLDIIHIPVLIYLMVVYFLKFKEYTENNGLGITIVLLFVIVFASFNLTMVAEGTVPIDSIVMVSNAFTSNGYTVLGSSTVGKVNSVFLVWSGYILSGVGTATLTAAILMRQSKKRFKEMDLIKKQNEELKTLVKKNNNQIKELRELFENNK